MSIFHAKSAKKESTSKTQSLLIIPFLPEAGQVMCLKLKHECFIF